MKIQSRQGSESTILSVGSYRPKRIVPNAEIVDRIESSDEWIQQRTGIQTRRFADESEQLLDMAIWAAEDALANAHLTSMTSIPSLLPPSLSHIKHRLQLLHFCSA